MSALYGSVFSFLATFIVTSIILLIVILRKNFKYWKIRNVPHEDPTIVFGSYKDYYLGKVSKFVTLDRWYNSQPDKKLIGAFDTRWPELIICDPDLIKHVLIKDFNHFMNRHFLYTHNKEVLINNLFHLESEKWKVMRPKMTPVFTSGKLKNMFPLILSRAEEFNRCISDKLKETDCFDVRDLMSRYTMDVIGSCAFGVDISSMKDNDTPFITMGKLSFELGFAKFLKDFIRSLSPEFCKFFNIRLFKEKLEDFMLNFVKNIIDVRNNKPSKRQDFIDLMLDMKNKEKLTPNEEIQMKLSEEMITANVFVIFAAGFETSSTVTSFALYELALNPEVQERLYESIIKVIDESNDQVTYENIAKMEYLEMVFSESLRKYPPLTSIERVCNSRYTFPNTNVTIDRDCAITIPIFSIHRDPKYYEKPKVFDPERFSSEAKKLRHPCVYLPFGDGPRNCIGARFGKVQSLVGLITVIRNYKVEVCERTENEIEFDNTAFIITPKNGLWLRFKRR